MTDFIKEKHGQTTIRVMDLASGPCMEIKELLSSGVLKNKSIIFDCYDNEDKAMEYAKSLLGNVSNVNFYKENALRLAAAKDIGSRIDKRYDFIYATGLFDYFNHKISVRLISNLKKLLKPGGVIAIANVRDKFSNPSVHFMEWVGDWNLVYRTDEEFKNTFIEAGFKESELRTQYEQQGVMQYIIATNKKGDDDCRDFDLRAWRALCGIEDGRLRAPRWDRRTVRGARGVNVFHAQRGLVCAGRGQGGPGVS